MLGYIWKVRLKEISGFARISSSIITSATIMGKNKRSCPEDVPEESDNVHSCRKKRVKYTEGDAKLAQLYNDLADEVPSVRIKAAGELLKKLSLESPDKQERLDAVSTRLIKGLCSGRKQARLGFSVALTEALRLAFGLASRPQGASFDLSVITQKVLNLTQPDGRASGQERRDYLLGRRFAFQAVLQSDVALARPESVTDGQWQDFLEAVFLLAGMKPWLCRECGAMVYEYLISPSGSQLSDERVNSIIVMMEKHKLLRTAECIGLWLTIEERFPNVKLPKNVWEHKDPLSLRNRDALAKALLENATDGESSIGKGGSRQSIPGFTWSVILSQLYQRDGGKQFAKFWDGIMASRVFASSSSAERKSLGFQVFSLAVSSAPKDLLYNVLHVALLRCILDQRASSERYLFDAAKTPLNQMIGRAKREREVAGKLAEYLLHNGAVNFDQLTKTKTVESIIGLADKKSLETLAIAIYGKIVEARKDDEAQADAHRRLLADLLLTMVRLHRDPSDIVIVPGDEDNVDSTNWMQAVLGDLAELAYSRQLATSPPLSLASRTMFRSRLMSCLSILLECPLKQAVKAPVYVVSRLVDELTADARKPYKRAADIVSQANQYMHDLYVARDDKPSSYAFALLFALSILQVWNEEPDALSVLEELNDCYRFEGEDIESMTTTLVELLLSFISKPSALFRKLAERVFSAFATELTEDGLRSMIDILGQKESLSGQQELFDQNDSDHEDVDSGSGEDDDDGINVEDASDVEIVNGDVASALGSDEDEDEGSEDASEGSSGAEEGASADEDEEAIFDKKLADALGTAGEDNDSDDDGSDMGDEQMMALEPHLTNIFKQRREQTSKKQEKRNAKENIVNFKNRVMDLLMIYVKGQYANILALDLILPLTILVRTTTSKPTAEKAFAVLKQYFESCSKNKSLPQPNDHDSCFAVLASVHEEMKRGGSKIHANACSRSSLFLSKVLVAVNQKYYQRIAAMYAELQSEWYLDAKSRVQGSVFTEWTSWSIGTRKHA